MSDIEKILKEVGCDPLKLSAQLAMGEPINAPSKDLPKIEAKWKSLLVSIQRGEVRKANLDELWNLIKDALSVTRPSKEIQSKHIISLTEYLHSKKKSIENINKIEHYENIADMSDSMLEKLIRGEDVSVVIDEIVDDSKSGT